MRSYVTALCLLLLFGVAETSQATTAVIDFNDSRDSTAGVVLIASGPHGAVTNVRIGGRNAVQTGGTKQNEFLYVAIPKGLFKNESEAAWAVVEYYDQGVDQFTFFYDRNGTEVQVTENPVVKHGTNAWMTHTFTLPEDDLTEVPAGYAALKIDDLADGPEIIDKITITDEDPDLVHWPHVDPAHPIKIDGVISPGEWDGAYTVTLDTAAQDAFAGLNWGGPQDFSGIYYYKWDETGLYVRGDVTDATPRMNDQTGDSAYQGDGFEEFLALDWSDPIHYSYWPGTDFHVEIGLGDAPNWGIADASTKGTKNKGSIPLQNLAIKTTAHPVGYQFEFYMPWRFLLNEAGNNTTMIHAGQQIGWFMFANNATSIPSTDEVAMSPFGRTNPSRNPSVWSTVVLDPPGAGQ